MKKFKISLIFVLTIVVLIISPFQDTILVFISAIFIHELGHLIIIKYQKKKIVEFEILPVGCYFTIASNVDESNGSKLLLYSFGVVFNLLYLLIGLVIKNALVVQINAAIILFNLLVIPPMDGYFICKHLLAYFIPYKKVLKINIIISLCLIFLIIFFLKISLMYYCYLIYFFILTIINYKNIRNDFESFLLKKYLSINLKLKNYRNDNINFPLLFL